MRRRWAAGAAGRATAPRLATGPTGRFRILARGSLPGPVGRFARARRATGLAGRFPTPARSGLDYRPSTGVAGCCCAGDEQKKKG
jgi:hypothetical protein